MKKRIIENIAYLCKARLITTANKYIISNCDVLRLASFLHNSNIKYFVSDQEILINRSYKD